MVWKPKRQRAATTRAKRLKTAERGYDHSWQKYTKQFKREHPLCVLCKVRGFSVPAEVTDHIIPHRGDKQLFWDPANHQALCKRCHDVDKAKIELAVPQHEVKRAWLRLLMDEGSDGVSKRSTATGGRGR